jgi:hypothetical protein
MLAIKTGSLQACIIRYMWGVGLCALGKLAVDMGSLQAFIIRDTVYGGMGLLAVHVEYASYPHGSLASLHNQLC